MTRPRAALALVHHPVLDRTGRVVATAVTPLDVHDLARLTVTYGLDRCYVVTPLPAQAALLGDLLRHWVEGAGGRANPWRRTALEAVRVVPDLAGALRDLGALWGRRPWVLATSARRGDGRISFGEARRRLAREGGLVVFGTGWGLAPEALEACDDLLEPVDPGTGYNHLSVRSAASIVVDRLWGGAKEIET
ncbi:RNA methyltransferase [Deferrisoma sp.]